MTLSIILAFAALTAAKAQESMTFAYASKNATVTPVGTMRNDTYDVAIALTNPSVYGMTITAIDIPVLPSQNISGLSAWLSTKLQLRSEGAVKVNVPDISIPLEMPTEGSGVQWVTVNLDEPYLIPDGGVYVGYSFTVDKLDDSNVTKYPIVATTGSEPGSLYLHTTRTYKNWEDRSSSLNAISMLQVTMTGSAIPDNAVRLGTVPFKYVSVDDENTVSVLVYNIGSMPISKLDYTVTAADESLSVSKEFDTPIPATFGYGEPVEFMLPKFSREGECEVTIDITAVNGEAFSGASAKGKVQVALFVPKHNALVEEYTGMWCGNCPRGFVAMEEMSEMYPDFIGIAYHNKDNLAMESGDPGITDGYPNASIDRCVVCDPYFADPASSTFSMPQVWSKYCEEFTPVEVEVEAVWDEDTQSVVATSTLNWATVPADVENGNYRMEYVLIADGLTNPKWYQVNYYANGKNGYPEYMDEFTHGPEYVFGLIFNDVAMLTSGFRGVKGSIPSVAVGEKTTHTFTFDTREAYNYYGQPFPFDKEHLRVAAFVLRGDGIGQVLNAGKCEVKVGGGIADITSESVTVGYYDLNGRKVANPAAGLYIRQTCDSAGIVSYQKVYIR